MATSVKVLNLFYALRYAIAKIITLVAIASTLPSRCVLQLHVHRHLALQKMWTKVNVSPVQSTPVISSPAIADTLHWLLEYYSTRCKVTQKPRVANNCVRVCTCACSAVRIGNVAESVLGRCRRSIQQSLLPVISGLDELFTERSEPIMLITCWYLCFPVSWALWFAIRCCCLASHRSASSPLTCVMLCLCFLFWSCLLLCWSPPQSAILESVMLLALVLATIRRCGTNFITFLYEVWHTHTYIYIYTYKH